MKWVKCLSCGEQIELNGKLQMGQIVVCDVCNAEFEIIGLHPLEIDWSFYDDGEGDDFEQYDDEYIEKYDKDSW